MSDKIRLVRFFFLSWIVISIPLLGLAAIAAITGLETALNVGRPYLNALPALVIITMGLGIILTVAKNHEM